MAVGVKSSGPGYKLLVAGATAITRILAQYPPYVHVQAQVTHDCASILENSAKITSCSHYFLHGAFLHHHSFR